MQREYSTESADSENVYIQENQCVNSETTVILRMSCLQKKNFSIFFFSMSMNDCLQHDIVCIAMFQNAVTVIPIHYNLMQTQRLLTKSADRTK